MQFRTRFAIICILLLSPLPARTSALAHEHEDLRRTPVVRAVEQVSPAVVNIQASKVYEREVNPFSGFFRNEEFPFFQDIFPSRKRRYEAKSLGSGVIIDGSKGLVLTNAHVITGASNISVRLLDGRRFEAELAGSDPDFDLALLELDIREKLPEVERGTSNDLLIGEPIIAIGNPFGFRHTVTTGVISALDRTVEGDSGTFTGFIQTDAAINPGNSGGPLLNIYGKLIGINTAIYAKAQGIGFAIPIDKAESVIQELVDYGRVKPVWLGISGQDIDQRIARYFGLETLSGMLITEVFPDTPASRAGLTQGDILLSLSGVRIKDKAHYLRLIRNMTRNRKAELVVLRDSDKRNISIKPEEFERERILELARKRWGFKVKEGGESLAVTRVIPKSPADSLGLRPGDRIFKIAGQRMKTNEDFLEAFTRYRLLNSLMMYVARGGQGYHVRLRM
ncbi:MAG: trypsin-like peptidase domain-containing protein [Desulfohalobiaceae bacterium]|nr:trypsin-like peptidase domain-containing protein [Desulfohalobiaceae bacterium]